MHLFVLSLCLVGYSLAAPQTTSTSHDHTKPCCMPKRWQAILLDLRSDTTFQYVTLYAYDADTMAEGSLTIRVDDETPVSQTFTDYKKMMKYTVQMFGDPSTHKCKTDKTSHKFYDHCFVGKDSTQADINPQFLSESSWGAVGMGIPFHAWNMKIEGLDITISLSDNECIPLIEGIQGMMDGKPINSLIMFNDFSTNVTTPQILQIPPACAAANH